MQTKSLALAALVAAVVGWAGLAQAQTGPVSAPYGYGYPAMMGGNPYAPAGYDAAAAGMMDPSMMMGGWRYCT